MNQGALLLAARAYEGQLEDPPGSNWGKPGNVCRRSLELLGQGAGASWCAGFVCLCVKEANGGRYPDGFKPSARALGLWELNGSIHVPKDSPEPEVVAIYDHGGGHGHTDIVIEVRSFSNAPTKFFTTIGGNTNKGGGRQGIGVFGGIKRSTDDPLLVGFLRLSKLRPVVA